MSAVSGDAKAQAQFGLINLLKAGAAQLIVLHHLAFYGPMSDHVRAILPELMDWLYSSARIAVQVFLVVGGFLAAKSLSPSGQPGHGDPLGAIWRRYLKLAPPFMVATLFAAFASLWAPLWMDHDSISAPATLGQLSAHALLLHGLLGYPSLSAGAWYVAIDFQLYALVVMGLWMAGRFAGENKASGLVSFITAFGIALSLLHFNLNADWDNWALYFFGSYGMGLMAWWASDPRRKAGAALLMIVMMMLPVLCGLMIEFRSRIALALAVACALLLFGRIRTTSTGRAWTAVNGLARTSYSVFLIHFPVCLLINAAFTRFVPADPLLQAFGMALAWACSLAAGAAFHHWIEVPLGRMFSSGRLGPRQAAFVS